MPRRLLNVALVAVGHDVRRLEFNDRFVGEVRGKGLVGHGYGLGGLGNELHSDHESQDLGVHKGTGILVTEMAGNAVDGMGLAVREEFPERPDFVGPAGHLGLELGNEALVEFLQTLGLNLAGHPGQTHRGERERSLRATVLGQALLFH